MVDQEYPFRRRWTDSEVWDHSFDGRPLSPAVLASFDSLFESGGDPPEEEVHGEDEQEHDGDDAPEDEIGHIATFPSVRQRRFGAACLPCTSALSSSPIGHVTKLMPDDI